MRCWFAEHKLKVSLQRSLMLAGAVVDPELTYEFAAASPQQPARRADELIDRFVCNRANR